MKNVLLLILFSVFLFAQNDIINRKEASVEKSVFNIQTGILGFWGSNELKLSKEFVLRTEVGVSPLIFGQNNTGWQPIVRLEPRVYHNLNNRVEKDKYIEKNSGNFFGLAFNYRPNSVIFSKNKEAIESFSIIPKWGIRRVINHFNYELGAGLGYRKETKIKENYAEIDVHIRIGYTF